MVTFITADEHGLVVRSRSIPQSAIEQCPFCIMVGSHYRDDNTCKCDDPTEREKMIREWDYTEEHFKDIPLREEHA